MGDANSDSRSFPGDANSPEGIPLERFAFWVMRISIRNLV